MILDLVKFLWEERLTVVVLAPHTPKWRLPKRLQILSLLYTFLLLKLKTKKERGKIARIRHWGKTWSIHSFNKRIIIINNTSFSFVKYSCLLNLVPFHNFRPSSAVQQKYSKSHTCNFKFCIGHIKKVTTGEINSIFRTYIQNIIISTCNQYKNINVLYMVYCKEFLYH